MPSEYGAALRRFDVPGFCSRMFLVYQGDFLENSANTLYEANHRTMTYIQRTPKSKAWLPIIMGATLLLPVFAPAENWTEFRGPTGQSHSRESGLPLTWSETEN